LQVQAGLSGFNETLEKLSNKERRRRSLCQLNSTYDVPNGSSDTKELRIYFMAKKIKILFLAANPVDTKYRLRLDEEFSQIRKKLRVGKERDCFKFESEWAVTPDDLQEVLSTHEPHIVHFSGHGSQTEGIALEDKSGNTFLLDKQAFAELLKIIKGNIRIVVLNACYAKDQAEALTEIIDFTIGMNKAIGDRAAIVFASYFYQHLASGRSVQAAFRLAKNQLDIFKIPESDTPELLVRYGVNPNEIILPDGHDQSKKKEAKKEKSHREQSHPDRGRSGVSFKNYKSKIRDQIGIKNDSGATE
jgi:hypothetical protein